MKRAIAWFAENAVAANLLMFLMVAGGLAALPVIQQKSFPDIDVDVIQVGVAYLGAAPEEVEEGVCVRVEEAIQGINGIERITSTATEGACGVSASLLSGYPTDRALTEIKNAVDGISTFPEETEKPVVSQIEVRRNALQIALAGEASERSLKVWGERVRDEISALPEVTQVNLTGARRYEVAIEVSEEALRRFGLSFDEVASAVRRGSLDRPGGSIKTRDGEVLLRTKGQAYDRDDFASIVVRTREDGTRLLVGDVATVRDAFEDDESYASFDGEPAVLVKVYRVGDQKVLDLVASVKAYIADSGWRLPEAIGLTVWRDGSQSLRDRLGILTRNGITGFILVFVVLSLFLRLRLAFWVSIGVPITFLGALAVFPMVPLSIDVISLFAFILVLGLLVDDAIVVGENVHRHQERNEGVLQASIQGAQEVAVPVIFGVLTTVAAFLPMVTSPGPLGQIFGAIGVVVMWCLFFSLVESQWVLPAHLGHMKIEDAESGGRVSRVFKRVQGRLSGALERFSRERYQPSLRRALEWRYSTLAGGVALLMIVGAVIASGTLKWTFFPVVESDYVTARLTLPAGTPAEVTAEAVRQLEASAKQMKTELDQEYDVDGESVVKHVLAAVGQQTVSNRSSTSSASHIGEVSIELMGGDVRPLSSREVADRWREATPPIPDLDELTFASSYFSFGEAVNVELQSPDVDQLQLAADSLKARLAEYPGILDINDSFKDGKREIRLDLLPSAEPLGLSLDDLARQVRSAFYGVEAQRIQRGRDDVRVMVRYPESERSALADLENLRIRTPAGGEVPFYAVARADWGRGYASIKRADRQRVINVTAEVDSAETSGNEIMADLRQNFLPQLMADYPGLSYGLEGEQREQRKTLTALLRNYGFALIVIYALLAVPLRSYIQPLLIMAVIPFGLVGAIVGHLIMRQTLSMMSVFGVVALSGVVVNASLVLVHYVNEQRRAGVPLERALLEAGVARFRPIVLTSVTTFAGLTPLLFEGSLSARFLVPMATSLGFGVLFATVISLFLVPSGYLVIEDLKRITGRSDPEPLPVSLAEPPSPRRAEAS